MITKEELMDWLERIGEGPLWIDEGGLTLIGDGGIAYLEIGGHPLDEDEEDEEENE